MTRGCPEAKVDLWADAQKLSVRAAAEGHGHGVPLATRLCTREHTSRIFNKPGSKFSLCENWVRKFQ